jgi:hypothetical protein
MGQINSKQKTESSGKKRPALFRALGDNDPPKEIEVCDQIYRCAKVYKHDSWAATARYENLDHRIVVKFNRQQSICGLPMSWLGRWLASRERHMLELLDDVDGVPKSCGDIVVDGQVSRTADGHDFVDGRPLKMGDIPNDQFLPKLMELIKQMHLHDIAYVDLHKAENVLVGDDGNPYMFDFQISAHLPSRWLKHLLSILQQSDIYHLSRQVGFYRPDQFADMFPEGLIRPWWIRVHRCVAMPFRQTRRKLLVLLGIRKGKGHAYSEHAPEVGKRTTADA